MKYPNAKRITHSSKMFNDERIDEFHWLRDKDWPNVIDKDILNYLEEENSYYHDIMGDEGELEESIYNEIISHIKLDDSTVPVKKDNFYYYTRTQSDSNHIIYCRKRGLQDEEEIIFDPNEFSKSLKYFSPNYVSVSPDHSKVLISYDDSGGERFTVVIKDLSYATMLNDRIENAINELIWSEDNDGFYYTRLDENWRANKIYYHQLGTKQADDRLIFEESDSSFEVYVTKSTSKRFIFVYSTSQDTSEVRYIDSLDKTKTLHLIKLRQESHLYYVEHHENKFYIRTNDSNKNFRIVKVDISNLAEWREFIPPSDSYLYEFTLYKDYLVTSIKDNGLTVIKLYDYSGKSIGIVPFSEPTYDAQISFTTYEDMKLRIIYSALNTPEMVIEYDYIKKELSILKEKEIPSGFNKNEYKTERVFAISKDGVKIPISLVYKKSLFKNNGSNPLYQYGYGAYGFSIPPSFMPRIISLLNRGFVYAISHVRGGDDLGMKWYEDGKLLSKKNTFDDFIACTEFLINNKYTSKGSIVISGASGGGMLVGACINERPELYKAAIMKVPFVDVLTTTLDDSLPLTPLEYPEWGNPESEEYYHYIKSYSPYDNIKKQDYPHVFVTSGLSDPRVTYWEPTKWVAKLRMMKTDNNLLLLHTNMDAGHYGNSGRFGHIRDTAREYSFIFKIFELVDIINKKH